MCVDGWERVYPLFDYNRVWGPKSVTPVFKRPTLPGVLLSSEVGVVDDRENNPSCVRNRVRTVIDRRTLLRVVFTIRDNNDDDDDPDKDLQTNFVLFCLSVYTIVFRT